MSKESKERKKNDQAISNEYSRLHSEKLKELREEEAKDNPDPDKIAAKKADIKAISEQAERHEKKLETQNKFKTSLVLKIAGGFITLFFTVLAVFCPMLRNWKDFKDKG